MGKENNLKAPWQKGESGNPKGRPRKFVCELRDQGYTRSQINDTLQVMLSMNITELAEVFKDNNATILEKTVAHALKKSLDKGTLYSVETLISRVFGQPKQETQTQVQIVDRFDFDLG